MPRFFIEVSYRGTRYSGFQVQENAATIQSSIEEAISTIQRNRIILTGSSRTDAGVHACSNYFHFDSDELHPQLVYKLNAILPGDIAVKTIQAMPSTSHCRFDAIGRLYHYRIHRYKDPFAENRSYYYPYNINRSLMDQAAALIKEQEMFEAFAKTNSAVSNFNCRIFQSRLEYSGSSFVYIIEANRFLRGMVRLLTAAILLVGREKLSVQELENLFIMRKKSGFSVPAHGLYLKEVKFPENYFLV